MKAYQHMKAKNDANGNPRRLFMVYEGRDFYAIDEGYSGRPKFLVDGYIELVPVNITAREYRDLLAEDTRQKTSQA